MTKQSGQNAKPELKRSGAYWVVSVPAGGEAEAIDLWQANGASGFSFNSVTGANQASVDRVLAGSQPVRLVFANMASLDYDAVYSCHSVQELVLGYECPWPDLTKLQRLTYFSVLEICGDLCELPPTLSGLSLYGYRGRDLQELSFLQHLSQLDLRMAARLENLTGISIHMADLTLAGCPRLHDLAAIEGHGALRRLYLSKCSGLKSADEVLTLPNLKELTLDKVPAKLDPQSVDALRLDFGFINGRRYGRKEMQ